MHKPALGQRDELRPNPSHSEEDTCPAVRHKNELQRRWSYVKWLEDDFHILKEKDRYPQSNTPNTFMNIVLIQKCLECNVIQGTSFQYNIICASIFHACKTWRKQTADRQFAVIEVIGLQHYCYVYRKT